LLSSSGIGQGGQASESIFNLLEGREHGIPVSGNRTLISRFGH
jgi:hypothetical protein